MSTGLSAPRICPHCGTANPPAANDCSQCGRGLPVPGVLASSSPTPADGGPRVPSVGAGPASSGGTPTPNAFGRTDAAGPASTREGGRTVAGLLLMVVGLSLSWVPYVDEVGELLILIAVILLFLGRWGFDESHRRAVLRGGGLVLAAIVVGLLVGVVFVGVVIDDASSIGTNSTAVSQFGATLVGQLDLLFVISAVLVFFTALGYTFLGSGLADAPTRRLLWAALVAQVGASAVQLALVLPLVRSAVHQATQGSTLDVSTITGVETTAALYGLVNAVPAILFAWAYYRVRETAIGWRPTPRIPEPSAPAGPG